MNAAQRDLVKRILSGHGIEGPAQLVTDLGADELMIVLPSLTGITNEEQVTRELQARLHRKVWIVAWSDLFEGRTEDL